MSRSELVPITKTRLTSWSDTVHAMAEKLILGHSSKMDAAYMLVDFAVVIEEFRDEEAVRTGDRHAL